MGRDTPRRGGLVRGNRYWIRGSQPPDSIHLPFHLPRSTSFAVSVASVPSTTFDPVWPVVSLYPTPYPLPPQFTRRTNPLPPNCNGNSSALSFCNSRVSTTSPRRLSIRPIPIPRQKFFLFSSTQPIRDLESMRYNRSAWGHAGFGLGR